jgi:uncharacterized protein
MFLLDNKVVLSASDVAGEFTCDFAALRTLDVVLGRVKAPATGTDPMLQRLARLGEWREKKYLEDMKSSHDVVEIAPPTAFDRASLEESHRATLAALREGASVVYQASLFDGEFYGRADFIVSEGVSPDRCYVVHDTKLARRAKVSALLQLASYVDQLEKAGIAVSRVAVLDLGNGEDFHYNLRDITPVYLERRARLSALLNHHLGAQSPVEWSHETVQRCGRCDVCVEEVQLSRDVLLVAGLRRTHRDVLRGVDIRTIEELAQYHGSPVSGISATTFARLHAQAALQVRQDEGGYDEQGHPKKVFAEVLDSQAMRALPASDDGDVFFDFEGDPLWSDDPFGGLEYLFGLVERDGGGYRSWWAHNREEERQALTAFFTYIEERRAKYPAMHIYHYAPYERTALQRLSARYGEGEEFLEKLLDGGVLVDLYATVRQGILVSQPSYSLKKLEPLYMTTERNADLDNAADSIVQYAIACDERRRGNNKGYQETLRLIESYNKYDCESTRELDEWLRKHADESSTNESEDGSIPQSEEPSAEGPDEDAGTSSTNLRAHILSLQGSLRNMAAEVESPEDQKAIALVGAAMGFFDREEKPLRWEHVNRLHGDLDSFSDTRDVLVAGAVEVGEWVEPPKKRLPHRTVTMTGTFPEGSTIKKGDLVTLLYAEPPEWMRRPAGATRAAHSRAKVEDITDDRVIIDEWLPEGKNDYSAPPVAVAPGPPISTTKIEEALALLGDGVLHDGLTNQPALDILRRLPPRYCADRETTEGDDIVSSISDSVLGLDHSYLAVQGPPGTGKTYVGARVIKNLIDKGWKIGVVAQSHAAIDNLLSEIVRAGVPKEQLAKRETGEGGAREWKVLKNTKGAQEFLEETGGRVFGGTAWGMTSLAPESLDLLVIDEAGQFSLAMTLAVSQSTTRLLLLGDPQQLPQVSRGTHPEPVDASALAWLCGDRPTLPDKFGYFLNTSHRMHPALCSRVSHLSYDSRLEAENVTLDRHLEGLSPGVHVRTLEHTGNSVCSVEEAEKVVELVGELAELKWIAGTDETPRPLGPEGILVVAAYNAQVNEIGRALKKRGLGGVRVGTVDNFQGKEAPVVIVSMSASGVDDVPRGISFLLSRNRINVAVSRAQWAAIVVRSTELTNYLPSTVSEVEELGAFIQLLQPTPTGAAPSPELTT